MGKWPDQPCLAHRQAQGSGYGPYESITYAEVADMVAHAAGGLFSLGMAPKQRLGIFGVNCVEWMVSLQVGLLPALRVAWAIHVHAAAHPTHAMAYTPAGRSCTPCCMWAGPTTWALYSAWAVYACIQQCS